MAVLEGKPPKAFYKKKLFLKISQYSGLNYWKETLAQVFSCEYCEIFQNTYFEEHMWTDTSEGNKKTKSVKK